MSVHVVASGSLQRKLASLKINWLWHYESSGGYPLDGFGLLFLGKKPVLEELLEVVWYLNLMKVVSAWPVIGDGSVFICPVNYQRKELNPICGFCCKSMSSLSNLSKAAWGTTEVPSTQ
jgi:hypothetical protein